MYCVTSKHPIKRDEDYYVTTEKDRDMIIDRLTQNGYTTSVRDVDPYKDELYHEHLWSLQGL